MLLEDICGHVCTFECVQICIHGCVSYVYCVSVNVLKNEDIRSRDVRRQILFGTVIVYLRIITSGRKCKSTEAIIEKSI